MGPAKVLSGRDLCGEVGLYQPQPRGRSASQERYLLPNSDRSIGPELCQTHKSTNSLRIRENIFRHIP